ncbi:MAG: Tab2/Atab2 family RNA-binding protein [Synechococcales cyanobacterium T60_A2020_003]|nr:Tab2/Atab2 family RNA-binding protein [Synechococcales cyanobacterium T60_A2020_003]
MTVIWELDYYSRPVLDENQKKLWEVLICETPTDIDRRPDSLFRFSKFCTSSEVNSVWLRTAIEEAIAQAPKAPDRVRFFRRQMNNMITKAVEDAGLTVSPSRRMLALHQWIQDRMAMVYPEMPNYQESANPSVAMGDSIPQPLPDALMGQQWAFVTLEAAAFADMPEWSIDFKEAFPLEMTGISPETKVPGLVIFSPRALPLAAWMSGLDLAFLDVVASPPKLVLETGANDAWTLATLGTPALQAEAQRFQEAKRAANNVHFVAVQDNPESESFAGFWLLQELALG